MTGKASTMSVETTSVIHVKTGNRIMLMPGARRFRIVTRKLKPAASEPIPRIWRPKSQKSMP
jgi:hypothetical protein